MTGCPIGIDIPGFIRLLREGNVAGAYEKIKEQNCLPSVCGRICSAPCELACVLTDEDAPIGIRALERYAADFGRPRFYRWDKMICKGKKIAIVGSGPAGLAAASELAQKGFQVTVFDALDRPGGVLRYGIPEFRIPKKNLDYEINEIKALGVLIETNFFVGQTATIDDLFNEGFVAILLATGAGVPKFMDLPGSHLGMVYYGEEFLMRVNQEKSGIFSKNNPSFALGKKIAVIGSGNTALDCARAALRFGREVRLVFRRTEEEMRVRNDVRLYGKEEGIIFEPLVKPVEILANQNNFVDGLKCVRMDFADPDETGQWQLIPVPDSKFVLDVDTVIIAIGHHPNVVLKKFTTNLKVNKEGAVKINEETTMTSIKGVFATGNVVTNAGPVVEAIAAGKKSAEQMSEYIQKL